MVERQTVDITGQTITVRPLRAVRQKCGYWVIEAQVEYRIAVGNGRTVVGTQIVKLTRGRLDIAPDFYRARSATRARAALASAPPPPEENKA